MNINKAWGYQRPICTYFLMPATANNANLSNPTVMQCNVSTACSCPGSINDRAATHYQIKLTHSTAPTDFISTISTTEPRPIRQTPSPFRKEDQTLGAE
jgi:hypothetical protein